jgi:hypothetical protein
MMISPCIGIIEFGALLPGAQERDEIPALFYVERHSAESTLPTHYFSPQRTGDCACDLESPIWKFGDASQVRRESGGNNQQPGDKCFLHVFLPCVDCGRRNANVPKTISSVPVYRKSVPLHRSDRSLQFEAAENGHARQHQTARIPTMVMSSTAPFGTYLRAACAIRATARSTS